MKTIAKSICLSIGEIATDALIQLDEEIESLICYSVTSDSRYIDKLQIELKELADFIIIIFQPDDLQNIQLAKDIFQFLKENDLFVLLLAIENNNTKSINEFKQYNHTIFPININSEDELDKYIYSFIQHLLCAEKEFMHAVISFSFKTFEEFLKSKGMAYLEIRHMSTSYILSEMLEQLLTIVSNRSGGIPKSAYIMYTFYINSNYSLLEIYEALQTISYGENSAFQIITDQKLSSNTLGVNVIVSGLQ